MTSQVARFVVGMGIGMNAGIGVCVVAECDVGDIGGVAAVVVGTLFPSPHSSSVDNLHSGITTISRVTGDRRCR